MRTVSRTVIQTVPVSIERVFALLTDPGRMAEWLPGCGGTVSDKPLRKGVRVKGRVGQRTTQFEVGDFTPPPTFGWGGRREGKRWKNCMPAPARGPWSPTCSRITTTPSI